MKKIIFIVIAVIALIFHPQHQVFAQSNSDRGDIVIVPQNQTIDHDYFAAGNTVEINGTINGDLYTAGQQITVNGTVTGDVIAAGQTILISGNVAHDVRAAGQNVYIRGNVNGNITAFGQTIHTDNTASVSGSLVAAGQNIIVNTTIPKDVTAAGETLTITAPVRGDVNARVATLNVTASINGNLTYSSSAQVHISPEASVSGQITKASPIPGLTPAEREQAREGFQKFFRTLASIAVLGNIITQLVIGLLIIWLVPKFFDTAASLINKKTGNTLLAGFLLLFITPIILTIILFTVLGIPLAFLGFMIYGILVYFSSIPVSIWVGNKIAQALNWNTTKYLQFVIGLLAVIIIGLIPFVGWLIKFIITIVGLGVWYLYFYQATRTQRQPVVKS